MTAILSCRNLVKSFASEPPLIVLDHLSADFHENEICAITGMSGKGEINVARNPGRNSQAR